MNFSLTYLGVIIASLGPVVAQATGLSDACGSEVATWLSTLPGALVAMIGRYRAGGITMAGFRVK